MYWYSAGESVCWCSLNVGITNKNLFFVLPVQNDSHCKTHITRNKNSLQYQHKIIGMASKSCIAKLLSKFPAFLFCFENFIKFLIKPEKTCIRNIPYPSIPFLDFNNLWKSIELPVEVRLQQSNCLNKLLSLKDI